MKLEHIISTMNRSEYSFLNAMNLRAPGLVINQNCEPDEYNICTDRNAEVRIISTPETGLSRSRNKLIENAIGDVCIIGDDDVEYFPGYIDHIMDAYQRHPDADIIIFRFTHERGKETRARFRKDVRFHLWNISKAASVEITFKRDSINKAGIQFNHEIGLGTNFPSGEENAFLADALRAGLKIYHVPQTICYAVEEHIVTDDSQLDRYLFTKGAAYYCIYKKLFFLYALGFIILKKNTLFKNISVIKAMGYMKRGKQAYMSQVNGREGLTIECF